VTNPTMLLENHDNRTLGDIFEEAMHFHNVKHAAWAAKLTVVDLVVVNQLIDTYGVSYRGASMVREYLNSR